MFAWSAATGCRWVTDSLDSRSFSADDDNDLEADDRALPGSILANPPGWCREGCVICNGTRPPIRQAGHGPDFEVGNLDKAQVRLLDPRSPRDVYLVTQSLK
jgi:hypothetical protein